MRNLGVAATRRALECNGRCRRRAGKLPAEAAEVKRVLECDNGEKTETGPEDESDLWEREATSGAIAELND